MEQVIGFNITCLNGGGMAEVIIPPFGRSSCGLIKSLFSVFVNNRSRMISVMGISGATAKINYPFQAIIFACGDILFDDFITIEL